MSKVCTISDIKDYKSSGLKLRDFCEKKNIHVHSMQSFSQQMGISLRGRNRILIDEKWLRFNLHLQQKEIAKHLGVSVPTLQKHLRKLGLKTEGHVNDAKARSPKTIERIKNLRNKGLSFRDIANQVSLSHEWVRNILLRSRS